MLKKTYYSGLDSHLIHFHFPRRNDSGGSAHSAFEPLLPNGTPSQLVPK